MSFFRSSMMLAGGGFTVWNPNDKSAGVVLSHGNLRATVAGAAHEAVRSINPRIHGKWYWEATLLLNAANDATVGVMRSNAILGSFVGADTNGYGYASDGNLYSGGGSLAFLGNYVTAGDVVGVAVDLDNRKVWFRANGGPWKGASSQDPVTNTGGTAIWATVPVHPACGVRNGQGFTTNFGASAFGTAPPTGFRAWGS